jgi:rod shape determining protein RodA
MMLSGGRLTFRERFDWPLFFGVVLIAVAGVVNLYSATSPYIGVEGRSALADVYVSQVYWLVVGGLFGVLVAAIDYRNLERIAYILYAGGIVSLLLVWVLAPDIRGSARWIQLGNFTFQPSEFMKLLLIIAVARYLADDPKTEARTLLDLTPVFLLTALPVALVMAQPDFGTSMAFLLTVVAMLSITRIRKASVAWTITLLPVIGAVLWFYVLRDYQKDRVRSFLDPEADVTGTGWHALQSRTAIGNGGLWGEGFREGTQNQFLFLPDQHSDFPFSVFAEDWGFAGTTALLALYCFLCVWSVHIASQAKDRFGAEVAVGVGSMFFLHTIFNIGMALGVLPVVGITLPLFSYGGSSIVTTLIGFGLLMGISMRR